MARGKQATKRTSTAATARKRGNGGGGGAPMTAGQFSPAQLRQITGRVDRLYDLTGQIKQQLSTLGGNAQTTGTSAKRTKQQTTGRTRTGSTAQEPMRASG